MPLFYFHIRTGSSLEPDDTGLDLPSAEAAYLAAFAAVPGLSLELLAKGGSPGHYAFEVVDGRGRCLWEIPFTEVIGQIHDLHTPNRRIG